MDLDPQPVIAAEVGALIVTCAMCGASVTIEYDALDQESGRVDPAHDFQDCPECGYPVDAQAVSFSALLAPRKSVGDQ